MESMDGATPQQFICPISLSVMREPVTAPTGITYDRRAIERWLAAGHSSCPVTGHPLSLHHLTPNLTLRRLILSWHHHSPSPPPEPLPASTDHVAVEDGVVERLIMVVSSTSTPCDVLREAAAVASESGVAQRRMVTAGVPRRVLRLAVSCARKSSMDAFDACLDLFHALDVSADELRPLVADNHALVDALTHVLIITTTTLDATAATGDGDADAMTRASAVTRLLESVTEVANASLLNRLKPDLFAAVTSMARRGRHVSHSALETLLHAASNCPRNRALAVDAGAARVAIELELDAASPRRGTELAMALLAELCACADGRASVATHPAGIAVVARRVLRVSACADACGVRVLAAVAGRAASPETLREMARVGAVGKLCCVLQADCDAAVKDTARAVLRMHSAVWSGSPCVSAYLLSRYL